MSAQPGTRGRRRMGVNVLIEEVGIESSEAVEYSEKWEKEY